MPAFLDDNYDDWCVAEVQRVNTFISDQRAKHDAEISQFRTLLDFEVSLSVELRSSLDTEIKRYNELLPSLDQEVSRCNNFRAQVEDKERTIEVLVIALDDERESMKVMEGKLSEKDERLNVLHAELLNVKQELAMARTDARETQMLGTQLRKSKRMTAILNEQVAELREEISRLRTPSAARAQSEISDDIRPHLSEQDEADMTLVEAMSQSLVIGKPSTEPDSNAEEEMSESGSEYEAVVPNQLREIATCEAGHQDPGSDYDSDSEDEASSESTESESAEPTSFKVSLCDGANYAPGESSKTKVSLDNEQADNWNVGQRQRDLARRAMRLSERDAQRSQEALQCGNKTLAGRLQREADTHRAQARERDRVAAKLIFSHFNPIYDSLNGCASLDLHHLFVREALEKVNTHLIRCRSENILRSKVIVGRGLHSVGGIPKLKPAVLNRLKKVSNIRVEKISGNPGSFDIVFT